MSRPMKRSLYRTLNRTFAVAMLGAALAACSDRAPVAAPDDVMADSVSASAATLDQEAGRASTAGDSLSATAFAAAAEALRYGVRPTDIAVTVDGETSRYQALVTGVVETLASRDTALRRTLVAWRSRERPLALLRVSTLADKGSFASEFEPASNPRARAQGLWLDLVRDSRWIATIGDATIKVVAVGESCGPLAAARSTTGVRCVKADFAIGVDGLFRLNGASPDDGKPAVRIQTAADRVNGVILARTTSTSTSR